MEPLIAGAIGLVAGLVIGFLGGMLLGNVELVELVELVG